MASESFIKSEILTLKHYLKLINDLKFIRRDSIINQFSYEKTESKKSILIFELETIDKRKIEFYFIDEKNFIDSDIISVTINNRKYTAERYTFKYYNFVYVISDYLKKILS